MFCGPAVNAARGVAMQVNNAVSGFVSNFQTALNPQITKSYASGNYDYMMQLIFQGARLSYYILMTMFPPWSRRIAAIEPIKFQPAKPNIFLSKDLSKMKW